MEAKSTSHEINSVTESTSSEKSFCCDICGKCFSLNSDLLMHEKVHKGEKPFTCTLCGKNFSSRSHLSIHDSFHPGKQPFYCSVYGKPFRSSSCLITRHEEHFKIRGRPQKINTGESERRLPCSVCGKCFVYKSELSAHERIHTGLKPYCCSVCGKNFRISSSLSIHKRVHSDIKPFSCSVCEKGFACNSERLGHERRVHMNFKPYFCHVCEKRFGHPSILSTHMKTHRDKDPLATDRSSSDAPQGQMNESNAIVNFVGISPNESFGDLPVTEEVDPLGELAVTEEFDPALESSVEEGFDPLQELVKEESDSFEIKEEIDSLELKEEMVSLEDVAPSHL